MLLEVSTKLSQLREESHAPWISISGVRLVEASMTRPPLGCGASTLRPLLFGEKDVHHLITSAASETA